MGRRRVQTLLGLAIAGVIVFLSWMPQFQEQEWKTLDWRFRLRGPLRMLPEIATVDIDVRTLAQEGRFQDWKRAPHTRLIELLHAFGVRLLAFDIYFSEPSSKTVSREEVERLPSVDRERLMGLFRDYDAELAQAMREAGNVYLAQTFIVSDKQDTAYVNANGKARTVRKEKAFHALEPFSLPYVEESHRGIEACLDMDPPLEELIRVARGVGFAQTAPDGDGAVRRYPLMYSYGGRVFPSLALIMACDVLQVPLRALEIVPGRRIKLPHAHLPDGEVVDVEIPMDGAGRMMVNWVGDWTAEGFLHVPYVLPPLLQKSRALEVVKGILHRKPGFLRDYERFRREVDVRSVGPPDLVEEAYSLLIYASVFEKALRSNPDVSVDDVLRAQGLSPDALPGEQRAFFSDLFEHVRINLRIAALLERDPDMPLEDIARTLGVQKPDAIRYEVAAIRELVQHGGIQPEDHPLYFPSVVLENRVVLPSDFKDKIFFAGLTAAGTHDLNPMPYNARYPMVGLHANALNTILTRRFLILLPKWFDALVMVLLGLATGWLTPRFGAVKGSLVVVGLLVLYLLVAFFLFVEKGLCLEVLGPVLTLALGHLAITSYNYVAEEREKHFVRDAFGHYLSPTVVDQLIRNPAMLYQLGGERRDMTAFFSDVAGFTSISEALGPERLVDIMNEYLDRMTTIISRYEGTVDKFEGDAVIAFYGAPLSLEDHAERGCLACLDMQSELAVLRERWREKEAPPFFVRMGVNTGTMMVGNMGSYTRMDYTMLGDAVNVAARLEPANKVYGTSMMVSEATYRAAQHVVEARELDRIRVQGRAEPVAIYELLGRKGEADDSLRDLLVCFGEGLALYRQYQWAEALERFGAALKIAPNDGPSKTYVQRCERFIHTPPPEDWDLVHVLEGK